MGYAFISYSTKNQSSADAVRTLFKAHGIDTWMAPYNIPAGSEYAEVLYDALNNCSCFVLLLTNDSQNSQWVRKEVNIAVSNGKTVIPVKLEDVELNSSMKLYLNDQQIVPVRVLDDSSEEVKRIIAAVSALVTNDPTTPPTVQKNDSESPKEVPTTAPIAAVKPQNDAPKKKSKKTLVVSAVIAIALIAAVLIAVFALSSKDNGENTTPNPTETKAETSTEQEPSANLPVVMSDDLSDLTVEIEGEVYKIPCAFSDFTDKGWTISSTGTSSDALIPGEDYLAIQLSKDGKKFYANIINTSGNAKKLKDCNVGMVEFQTSYGVDAKIAKGITTTSTKEEIQTAFGIPTSIDEYSSSTTLTYSFDDNYTYYVKFNIDEDPKYSTIQLKNYVKPENEKTETNPTAPLYLNDYKAPTELGNDPISCTFSIGEKVYQLPMPVTELINDGWTITSQPGYIVSGGTNYITLKKDDKLYEASIANLAEYQTIPTNCIVYGFTAYDSDNLDVSLPGLTSKIKLGMTNDELKAQLPATFSVSEGVFGNSYSYYDYDNDISIYFSVSNETGTLASFNISNPNWKY